MHGMSRPLMKKVITVVLTTLIALMVLATSAADIELPEIGDSAGSLISPQQEYRIGQAFFWRLQQSVELVEDPEVVSYLSELGNRLVANSDAPQLSFNFFMVPDDTVNAFAAPGGFIGVNSGLLLTSEQEDELASVLAHEIAHITQRHLLRSFEKQKQMSIPSMVGMIAGALVGIADPKLGAAAITAIQAGGVQARINFTRNHEKEADNLGMQTLISSGFDPLAMPSFFERLQRASRFYTGNAVPEFLRTHPVTTSRIASSRSRAVQYTNQFQPQMNEQLQFLLIREKLRILTSRDYSQLSQRYEAALETGSRDSKIASRYGYSLALSAMGQYSKAKSQLMQLIKQDAERLTYQLALADIEMADGNVATALEIYRAAQRLFPDDYALSMNQAVSLLQVEQAAEAKKILMKQFYMGHKTQQLHKLLARAHGDMGQNSEGHQWLAEYYFNAGRFEQALDQLQLATKFADKNEYQLAKINSRIQAIKAIKTQVEEL